MEPKIHIFTGHFGSGKTEVVLNYALFCKSVGETVTIIDLDTVNPYFRTKDAEQILKNNSVDVIAGEFASSNIDMPVVPLDIMSVFEREGTVIFDIGGDEDGAYALGQYHEMIKKTGYEMHLVTNMRRPLTEKAEDFCGLINNIEKACRLRITDIWSNTNLGKLTDAEVVESGLKEAIRLSELADLPVKYVCGRADVLKNIPDKYEKLIIETRIKMVFE